MQDQAKSASEKSSAVEIGISESFLASNPEARAKAESLQQQLKPLQLLLKNRVLGPGPKHARAQGPCVSEASEAAEAAEAANAYEISESLDLAQQCQWGLLKKSKTLRMGLPVWNILVGSAVTFFAYSEAPNSSIILDKL